MSFFMNCKKYSSAGAPIYPLIRAVKNWRHLPFPLYSLLCEIVRLLPVNGFWFSSVLFGSKFIPYQKALTQGSPNHPVTFKCIPSSSSLFNARTSAAWKYLLIDRKSTSTLFCAVYTVHYWGCGVLVCTICTYTVHIMIYSSPFCR